MSSMKYSSEVSRRQFVHGLMVGGAALGLGMRPQSGWALGTAGYPGVLAGTDFDLTIGETTMNFTGRTRPAIAVNGSVPAPIRQRM